MSHQPTKQSGVSSNKTHRTSQNKHETARAQRISPITRMLELPLTDDPSSQEMFDSFKIESLFDHEGDDDRAHITHRYDELTRIRRIHELTRHIEKNRRAEAFERLRSKSGMERFQPTSLGLTCFAALTNTFPQRDRGVRLSEEVELFTNVAEELGFPLSCSSPTQRVSDWMNSSSDLSHFDGATVIEAVEIFLSRLRTEIKTKKFQQRRNDRLLQSHRNYQSARSYIDALFDRYKRLLVIRVDLHFAKEGVPRPSQEEIAELTRRFFNNFRHTQYGAKKVGYVWKLEDGHSRGPHIHLLLLLNASEHQKHAYIAEELGKYWSGNIAVEKGYYFSCHRKRFEYKYPALGIVDRNDEEKRQNIYRILRYFTKAEQFMKIAGVRCFGMGRMPPVRPIPLGRPPSAQKPFH